MEAAPSEEKKEEQKQETKVDDKQNSHSTRKLLNSKYYELVKNIFNYFVANSENKLKVPLKPEDMELEVELANDGVKNIKFYNRGKEDYYKSNTDKEYNELISGFKKLKDDMELETKIEDKNIMLSPKDEKRNIFSCEGTFTIDNEGKKIEYTLPKVKGYILVLSTYINKITEKTITYLRNVDFGTLFDKYEKIIFFINVPKKLEVDLKDVKKRAEEFINKLDDVKKDSEKFQVLYSIYEKGYDKFLTQETIKRVIGNYTKFCVVDRKLEVQEIYEIESRVGSKLEDVKFHIIIDNINVHNFFKLIKNLKNAEYIFTFKFKMNMSLKCQEEDKEELRASDLSCSDLKASLRTKDYNFLKNEVFLEDLKDFDIKEVETFDIELPQEIKCKNCNEVIPNEKGVYYCHWCKIFFCEKCVEDKFKEENNKNKYLHKEHNICYFYTRDQEKLKNLDKKKLGKNVYLDRPARELEFSHSAICNGCRGGFQHSPRYLCVSCRPGTVGSNGFCDFCMTCVKNMREGNEEGQRIERLVQAEDEHMTTDFDTPSKADKYHSHDHVYLCLICKCYDYDYYSF